MPKGIMTTTSVGGNTGDATLKAKIDALFANKGNVVTAKKKDLSGVTETSALFDTSIAAHPLMAPSEFNIVRKHMEYEYRWVNMKARGGAMYYAWLYKGATNATSDDVEVNNKEFIRPDGSISNGELILVKFPKELYYGALKHNLRKSLELTSRKGVATSAQTSSREVKSEAGHANGPDLKLFIPPEEILNRAVEFHENTTGETLIGA